MELNSGDTSVDDVEGVTMKKQLTFFRVLSIVLLVAYLNCLLPPPAALCQQSESQHRLQKFMNEDTPAFSPILRYCVNRPATSNTLEIGAFPTGPNRVAVAHMSGLPFAGGIGDSGKRIIGNAQLWTACGTVSLKHAIGQAEGEVSDFESKPWYKKWWVIGLGAAVVAGSVLLIAGGGDDSEPVAAQPLPGFPDPPAPAFR